MFLVQISNLRPKELTQLSTTELHTLKFNIILQLFPNPKTKIILILSSSFFPTQKLK
jgi:hypothetical protein